MSENILFICNSIQGYNEVKAIEDENDNIEILEYNRDLGLSYILSKIKHECPKAVIALPMTGNEISLEVDIPVVLLDPGALDFLEAFFIAKNYCNEAINFIGFAHPTLLENLSQFEQILEIKINTFTYKNASQKEKLLNPVFRSHNLLF